MSQVKMRGKFKVSEVRATEYSDNLTMNAVCGGSKEDNTYSAATPSGKIEMQVNNPDLRGQIKPGEEFYVDFVLIPKAQ